MPYASAEDRRANAIRRRASKLEEFRTKEKVTRARKHLEKYGHSRDMRGVNSPRRFKPEETRGALNCRWNPGKMKHSGGYVVVRAPVGFQHSWGGGYAFEHIVIATEKMGREPLPDEVVHHINRIKTDNRPENLMVLTRSQHKSLHNRMFYAEVRR